MAPWISLFASSRFAPFLAVYCFAFFIYELLKVAGNFYALLIVLPANVAKRGRLSLIKNIPPPAKLR